MSHATGNPLDQPMPARDPDPDATLAEQGRGGRGPGRMTLALGALAVLAVGVLVGVVVRGAVGGDGTSTVAAGNRGGFAGGAAGGEGFPGGGAGGAGAAGGFGGQGGGTSGTVSDLSGSTFTLTTTDGSTVQVTVGPDTTVSVEATGATSGSLADGDTVTVTGTESNGAITATAVREGTFGGGQRGTQPNA